MIFLASALLTLALYSAVSRLTLPPEPSYEGRTLSQWLWASDDHPVPAGTTPHYEGPKASAAVRHIGTNAIPYLLEWLHYEESPLRDKFQRVVARVGQLVGWRPKSAENRQIYAQLGFDQLGPQARTVIPELVRLMNDPKAPGTARAATDALACVRTKEAFTLVLAVMTNKQHHAREAAVASIYRCEAHARQASPALIQCLQDTNPAIVIRAASSLARLKPEPGLVVPALAAHLNDSEICVRQWMAEMLANFGTQARPAVPALLKALQDPNPSVRRAAADALLRIAPEALPNAPPK